MGRGSGDETQALRLLMRHRGLGPGVRGERRVDQQHECERTAPAS